MNETALNFTAIGQSGKWIGPIGITFFTKLTEAKLYTRNLA